MISLANKLIACGASAPASQSWAVGISSATFNLLPAGTAISGTDYVVVSSVAETFYYAHIASIDTTGSENWQRKLTFSTSVFAKGVATDSSGNIYVLCRDDQTYAKVILCKYTSAGALSWQRSISLASVTTDYKMKIAVSAAGNIYVAVGHVLSTRLAITLLKYTSAGALSWQKQISSASLALNIGDIACDASENIFVVHFSATKKMHVSKFNNAGGRVGTFQFENTYDATAAGGCCVDEGGNLYIATNSSLGLAGPVIIKLNNSLVLQGYLKLTLAYPSMTSVAVRYNVLLAQMHTSTSTGYLTASSSLALSTQRTITPSLGGTVFGGKCLLDADGNGLLAVYAKASSATYYDSLLFKLNLGDDLGVYGNITLAESTLTVSTVGSTTPTDTFVDASGTFTDAAGGLTDAAASLTITLYPKA